MSKQKVLLVAAGFYPKNSPRSFRATELATELARQGHEVVVYIPDNGFDYSDFAKEHDIQIKHLGVLSYKAVQLKGKGIELVVRRVIRRAMGLLFEYPNIELMFRVAKKLKYEKGYNLYISIAVPYPIHWGVAWIRPQRKNLCKTWIADCGDPYMGDTTDSFRKMFYFKYVEKWFSRRADFITIPFEGAKTAYYPEFLPKLRIIPQGFQLDKLKISGKKSHSNRCPEFAYAGGFIPGKRDPGPFLKNLANCNRNFKFIVYTSNTKLLLPFKTALGEKLEIRDQIPREDLLVVLSEMDFLINFDNNTTTQLPSKLIDYSITGRPVLNIKNSTDFSILEDFFDGDFSNKMKLAPASDYDIKGIANKFIRLHTEI